MNCLLNVQGKIFRIIKHLSIAYLGLLSIPFLGCTVKPDKPKIINVVFRWDDYSALSSTDFEMKILDLFHKSGISVTLGVIPFECAINQLDTIHQENIPLTIAKSEILKNALKDGTIEVALHGFSHQTTSMQKRTEFAGLDYNIQLDKLATGKKFLENIISVPINIFVPPFNQYDNNTLKALENLGFSTISAFKGGPALNHSQLRFVPATCSLIDLRNAVYEAKSSAQNNPLIVVLFHDYDFKEIDNRFGSTTYQEFFDLLQWLKSQDDVRIMSIGQATEVISNLGIDRFISDKWIGRISHLLPLAFIGREYITGYAESSDLSHIILKAVIFYLGVIGIAIFLSYVVGYFIFRRSASHIKFTIFALLMLSILTLIVTVVNMQLLIFSLITSSFFIGAAIGMLLYLRSFKRKSIQVLRS